MTVAIVVYKGLIPVVGRILTDMRLQAKDIHLQSKDLYLQPKDKDFIAAFQNLYCLKLLSGMQCPKR